jgi:threonine aldolase
MKIFDLRSDTVTLPCVNMRNAMANATLGDDVFNEDPTVNELQNYAAQLFGKEASLFCSSGTQTNQIAIATHVQPGGEVICHKESHIYKYEGGGIARNAGASVRLLEGDFGLLKSEDISKWINPDDVHFPVTQLISLEDTFNRGGGAIYELSEIQKIAIVAKNNLIPLHLDGARLFNALVVTKVEPKEYAKNFDSISICLSKGLGAPVGSLLLGSNDFIKKAKRIRKVFGGGMRQAGIIAAGGLFALQNNIEKLILDHENAQLIASTLGSKSYVKSTLPVATNIVVVSLENQFKRDQFIADCLEKGIKCMAFGPEQIRFVTHLNISKEDTVEICRLLDKIQIHP